MAELALKKIQNKKMNLSIGKVHNRIFHWQIKAPLEIIVKRSIILEFFMIHNVYNEYRKDFQYWILIGGVSQHFQSDSLQCWPSFSLSRCAFGKPEGARIPVKLQMAGVRRGKSFLLVFPMPTCVSIS